MDRFGRELLAHVVRIRASDASAHTATARGPRVCGVDMADPRDRGGLAQCCRPTRGAGRSIQYHGHYPPRMAAVMKQVGRSKVFYKTGRKGLSFEDMFGEPVLPRIVALRGENDLPA